MQAFIKPIFLQLPAERIAYLNQLINSHPELKSQPQRYVMSRQELIESSMSHNVAVKALVDQGGLTSEEIEYLFASRADTTGISLHYFVFISALKLLSSPEQFSFYQPYAEKLQMIGSYAQTELGHGSNVQDLETIAEYDVSTQEFVFNSPTISSVKWWMGGLGLLATHTILFAKLKVGSQDYGLHCFLIPVRDPSNMKPYPGIEVGDIGEKFGANTLDNGFMRLINYRTPKTCMLERFARLSPSGELEITEADPKKVLYSSMLNLRVRIGANMWKLLPIALTIAVRYSCYRKQFRTLPDAPSTERTLLDYQLQQYKLLPYLALSYALSFATRAILAKYEVFSRASEAGDNSLTAEMHCLATAWKAFNTWNAAKGIEICRLSCGGHGYHSFSGLGWLYTSTLPSSTYEGDNTLLCQQSAVVLVKAFDAYTRGKPLAGDFGFFDPLISPADPTSPDFYSNCFKALLRVLTARLAEKRGQSEALIQIDAVTLSRVYIAYFIHENFQVSLLSAPSGLGQPLLALKQIYALSELLDVIHPLLQERLVSAETVQKMRRDYDALLKKVRPEALSLVEAFGIEDHVLCSAIGNSRGEPYEDLMNWVRNLNPVRGVNATVLSHIKPLAKL
jgi:alkylation response protein AidB-like acyl-CoA dehydrogenase